MKKAMFARAMCMACVVLSFSQVMASVLIFESGSYENEDIIFQTHFSWGNDTPDPNGNMHQFSEVQFTIASKKGEAIFNKTCFTFGGEPYLFTAANIKNSFYEKGERTFDNKTLKDGAIIELVYQMRQESSSRYIQTRTVKKRFRLERPGEGWKKGFDVKLTLHELKTDQ